MLLSGCSSFLYYPSSELYYPPAKLQLQPEELWISTDSQERVHGWYFHTDQSQKPKGVVVAFHGNAENLSSHYLGLVWLPSNGYDFFIFDYRGYGKSQGSPSPESTLEDGQKVLHAIHKKNPTLPLVILGQSLGGIVALRSALETQAQIPIQLIIIESSFLSYKLVARSVLAHNWLTWIFQPLAYLVMSDATAPGKRIAELAPIPLVIIHGDQDPIVDFSLGEEIYKLAKEPKEFWSIPGGGHIDSFWRKTPNTRQRLLTKLDSLFCQRPCRAESLKKGPGPGP